MEQIKTQPFHLIGLRLENKTTNEGGKSGVDWGYLWLQFEQQHIADRIPGKESNSVYAVYYDYERAHDGPFSYFIGCMVQPGTEVPRELSCLIIPQGNYVKLLAKGKMPACILDTWKDIWGSNMKRAYTYDFEVYDERSWDWSDAEVDIFIAHDATGIPSPLKGNQVLIFQRSLE